MVREWGEKSYFDHIITLVISQMNDVWNKLGNLFFLLSFSFNFYYDQ